MADKGTSLVFHPFRSITEEWKESENTLWLEIIPKKFTLNTDSATAFTATQDKNFPTYRFMFPMEWSFGLNHSWDERGTVAGKFRDLKNAASTQGAELGNIANVISGGFVEGDWGNHAVRNDNPITYKNTDRLRYLFTLEFHTEGDNESDVYSPIEDLMALSSAAGGPTGPSATEIQFPYVFGLQTRNGKGEAVRLVSTKAAVINSIQPTYKGPYINGYPSHANLDITFTVVQPTYRDTTFGDDRNKKNITVRESRDTAADINEIDGF